ncbi:MAG: hypothetical protein CMM06_01600 [Rhodopirellula sp.]|nr:hypothetical protein [Rhodopirellula sp.]HCA49139.1 hypothetical protein [Planctomycetaceae bacterium]
MIVSYKHKFIFVHLGRTGGRSLTESLIPHCDADDIITPVGNHPGQNHHGWHRHESAVSIRDRLGREFFEECYVFTVDRNPWDKVLSNYWAYKGYSHGKGGKTEQISIFERLWRAISGYPWSFDTWLKYRALKSKLPGSNVRFPVSFNKFADGEGEIIVDKIFRFEEFQESVKELSMKLGFQVDWRQSQGTGTRKNRESYRTQYSPYGTQLVADVFSKEIELLGYTF